MTHAQLLNDLGWILILLWVGWRAIKMLRSWKAGHAVNPKSLIFVGMALVSIIAYAAKHFF